MHTRLTAVRPSFATLDRMVPLANWSVPFRHPVRYARSRWHHRIEQRHLERAWRIRQAEEYWLRLSAMTDERVVGLDKDRAGHGTPRAGVPAV